MTELSKHILGLSFTTVYSSIGPWLEPEKQTYQQGKDTARYKGVGRLIVPPEVCRRLLLTRFQDQGQGNQSIKHLLRRTSDSTTTMMIALTMTAKHQAKTNSRIRDTDPTHPQKKLTVVEMMLLQTTRRKKNASMSTHWQQRPDDSNRWNVPTTSTTQTQPSKRSIGNHLKHCGKQLTRA